MNSCGRSMRALDEDRRLALSRPFARYPLARRDFLDRHAGGQFLDQPQVALRELALRRALAPRPGPGFWVVLLHRPRFPHSEIKVASVYLLCNKLFSIFHDSVDSRGDWSSRDREFTGRPERDATESHELSYPHSRAAGLSTGAEPGRPVCVRSLGRLVTARSQRLPGRRDLHVARAAIGPRA